MGSPNINILEMTGTNINLDEIKLNHEKMNFLFTPVSSSITIQEDQELLMGIRPEDIILGPEGPVKGKIYSTLPSGMETIVKIDVEGFILTSVVFGGVDFSVGEEISLSFPADKYILFDRKTEKKLAGGKLL